MVSELVAENGSNDASVEDTIAGPGKQYMVIDIRGKFNFIEEIGLISFLSGNFFAQNS